MDFIAFSFVRERSDIEQLRRLLARRNSKALIVAKIEDQLAVRSIEKMIECADVIMVARCALSEAAALAIQKMLSSKMSGENSGFSRDVGGVAARFEASRVYAAQQNAALHLEPATAPRADLYLH